MRLQSYFCLTMSGLGLAATVACSAPTPLIPLVGSWTGTGSVRLENGQQEAVRCKAYYTDRGAALGVAVRCASAGSKIDLRATLDAVGNKVTGTWEERQFNASGSIDGQIAGNKLSLDMNGGGLTASVVVATSGSNQTLSMNTATGSFRAVTIAFARD